MIFRTWGCEGVMEDQDKIFESELCPEMFEEFKGTEEEWKEYVAFMNIGGADEDFELPFR